jgi:hypothetical protein
MEEHVMFWKSIVALVSIFLLGMVNTATAQIQVWEYYHCSVESSAAVEDAVSRYHEEIAGGLRPTIIMGEILWNGDDESTHEFLFGHADYQSYDAFQARLADLPAAALIIRDASAFSECNTDGLAVTRGEWGDQDADQNYSAVFPIVTSDPGEYLEAFEELATSEIGMAAPAAFGIYESRAGGEGTNFFVVFDAPTMAELNQYLDMLTQSDDFADFDDQVRAIRTVGSGFQRRHIRTWEP